LDLDVRHLLCPIVSSWRRPGHDRPAIRDAGVRRAGTALDAVARATVLSRAVPSSGAQGKMGDLMADAAEADADLAVTVSLHSVGCAIVGGPVHASRGIGRAS
jgi:hypothetical protein